MHSGLLECSNDCIMTVYILQWLKYDFLGYLDEWEASSQAQEGLSQAENNKLCISRETLEGLSFTGGTHAYVYYNLALIW